MKQIILPALAMLCLGNAVMAQDCSVLSEKLRGRYEGACVNGKANGMGKATGEDMYEGEFKAGLPAGKGRYTWRNGNMYEGEFRNGLMEGKGVMSFKLSNKDSIVTGIWKRNEYVGRYEKPYIIHKKTVHITSIACRKMNNSRNELDIYVSAETGTFATSMSDHSEKENPKITDVTLINGRYEKVTVNSDNAKKTIYTYEQVTYPFRALISIGTDQVEVEILEPGKWLLDLKLAY